MQIVMKATKDTAFGRLETGREYEIDDGVGAAWIASGLATDASVDDLAASTPLSVSRGAAGTDDGKRYYATTAITLAIPKGLRPRPELTVLPPPTGNLTIAFSGGATGNGAATSITRTRAANPAGIVITPYPDVTDGYGVSGA